MRQLLAGSVLLLAACAAPPDAIVQRCHSSPLSLFTQCTLSAVRLPGQRIAHIDANTKNFKVRVSGTFSVQKGHIEVAIPGCALGGVAQVTPDQPASLQCEAAISRSTYEFAVVAKPVEGEAEGFAGTLEFRAI